MHFVALAFACVLAACGSSAPPPTTTPATNQPTLVDPPAVPAPVADCATANKHVLDVMTPGGAIQAHVDLNVARCTEDGWSSSARSCMATAMSRAQGQSCFDRELTNEQRKKLGEALLAAFGDKR